MRGVLSDGDSAFAYIMARLHEPGLNRLVQSAVGVQCVRVRLGDCATLKAMQQVIMTAAQLVAGFADHPLEGKSADPGRAWKEARQDARAQRRGLFLALAGLYLLLLARSLLGQPDWAAALLGLGALPVLLTPTCYYTGALFFFALLWPRRPSIGVALCLLSLAQWLVAARFHAFDELYTWSGLAAVLFVVYATAAARLPLRAAPERA